MSRPVTIRLGENSSVVSRDDGATFELSSVAAEHLRTEASRLTENPDGWRYDCPSAATRSGLAEASEVRPMETSWAPRTPKVHTGQRVHVSDVGLVRSRPLARILLQRSSERRLGSLTLTELASMLVRTGRLLAWRSGPGDVEERHKPVPSAGARHPNELFVLASMVDGLEPGWWYFDSASCNLVQQDMDFDDESVWRDLSRAASLVGRPGAAIFALANFDRTLSRYPAGGSLVWRDAGALLATLHLCAVDVGLDSCIVGLAGSVVLDDDNAIADVGALVIGHHL